MKNYICENCFTLPICLTRDMIERIYKCSILRKRLSSETFHMRDHEDYIHSPKTIQLYEGPIFVALLNEPVIQIAEHPTKNSCIVMYNLVDFKTNKRTWVNTIIIDSEDSLKVDDWTVKVILRE